MDILCNSYDGLAHVGGASLTSAFALAHCFRSRIVDDIQAVAVQWNISSPSEGRRQSETQGER